MSAHAPSLIGIVGPTAVGKSEVAQIVAEKTGGEVVSVDAFQIYRGMDIGTAKLAHTERRVPHHMLDIAEISEEYSVARFQTAARTAIDQLRLNGKTPVLAGGSGLYLDAVIDEMDFPKGQLDSKARTKYVHYLEEYGAEKLYQLLCEKDPEAAELINPHNTKRIIRALEMIDQGTLYSAQHKGLTKRKPHYEIRLFALTLPRETLYQRINERVDAMMERGLLEEVATLQEQGLAQTTIAKQAIGYAELLDYLNGTRDLPSALEAIKKRSRHYAKRQLSWIKRDGRAQELDMSTFTPEDAANAIVNF